MNTDFVELAKYCQIEYKESIDTKKEKYQKTLFVSIKEDNEILVSTTPHILANASKCILIHEKLELAITNYYSWYCVQFINENGEVLTNRIDDEFEIEIEAKGGFANQYLSLSADNREYYSCKAPWENSVKSVWNLYVRLKKASSTYERELISSLFIKDKKILELENEEHEFMYRAKFMENEKNLYKEILDEIRGLIEQKE